MEESRETFNGAAPHSMAFMLGKSDTTGRDSYMFFGDDGELMSIKWKFYKTVLRFTVDSPALQSGYIKPQFPMMYNLSSDRTRMTIRLTPI